ncbi:hypothetical protein B0H19DRAFT_1247142 [Mycena capillaripes]|nr:hypothetical protein B0H19DRAFT_1247142 [Mycena capillaripes]
MGPEPIIRLYTPSTKPSAVLEYTRVAPSCYQYTHDTPVSPREGVKATSASGSITGTFKTKARARGIWYSNQDRRGRPTFDVPPDDFLTFGRESDSFLQDSILAWDLLSTPPLGLLRTSSHIQPDRGSNTTIFFLFSTAAAAAFWTIKRVARNL